MRRTGGSRMVAMALRALALLGLVGLPAAISLAANTAPAAASNVVTVRMHEFKFCTDAACTQDSKLGGVVTIHTGDVVKWVWDESSTDLLPNCDTILLQLPIPVNCPGHTTTATNTGPSGGPLWDSGTCAAPDGHAAGTSAGCPYAVTFASPGSFSYFCVYHGGANANNPITHMNGVVVVTGAPVNGGGTVAGTGTGSGVSAATDGSNMIPGLPDTGSGPNDLVGRFGSILFLGIGVYILAAVGVGLALAPRR
jgi:plastocyanin